MTSPTFKTIPIRPETKALLAECRDLMPKDDFGRPPQQYTIVHRAVQEMLVRLKTQQQPKQ